MNTKERVLYYLDAHFYDENLPKGRGKFVVLKELKALKNRKNCIIVIHDFDNNLGHITYDKISLDLNLIKKDLFKVNPEFYLYTNELASCDILTTNSQDILSTGLPYNEDILDNLNYAWKEPRLTYRGILYALPFKLDKAEMNALGLREWN